MSKPALLMMAERSVSIPLIPENCWTNMNIIPTIKPFAYSDLNAARIGFSSTSSDCCAAGDSGMNQIRTACNAPTTPPR